MTRYGVVIAALAAACGGKVVVDPGGDGAGGGGGDPSTSSGGNEGSQTRTITVTSYDGAPEPGVDVMGHDDDGSLVAHAVTDGDGKAYVDVPDDGTITVGYVLTDILPGEDGVTEAVTASILRSYGLVGDLTAFDLRLSRPVTRTLNPPMTLEVVANVPATTLYVAPTCATPMPVEANGTSSLEARGCPGESSLDVHVVAVQGDAFVGQMFVEGIPHEAGGVATVSVSPGDLSPVDESVFVVSSPLGMSVTVSGLNPGGGFRRFGISSVQPPGFGNSTETVVAMPPSDGVDGWSVFIRETESLVSRTQRVTSVPPLTEWTAPSLALPSAPALSVPSDHLLDASWSLGSGPTGEAVEVRWHTEDQRSSWAVYLPPSATQFSFPSLPAQVQVAPPPPGESSVVVFVADGNERDAIFGLSYSEIVYRGGPMTPHP